MNDRAGGHAETTAEPARQQPSPVGDPAEPSQTGIDLVIGLQRSAGNAAVGVLLAGAGDPRGAHPHVRAHALVAGRRTLLRQSPTRDEMLEALARERAAAAANPADPERWKDIALRLNGFNKADIQRLTAGFSIDELKQTRAATERVLSGWPEQRTILDALDAAGRAKGSPLRPQSSTVWAAYSKVSYAVWHGEPQKNKAWEFIGGSVGKGFVGQNTCAARVSYAFNYGGFPISGARPLWSYRNDPNTSYGGKSGDAKNYIVSAPYMQEFLTAKWGKPDASIRKGEEASALEATLRPDQVAVFAGPHHSGLIKQGYSDPYVLQPDDGGRVMPVVAWILP
jgi:hypothetical protein